MQDETAKDNCQTETWISLDLIWNNELAFSSTMTRLIFKNQTTDFRIDLEVSVSCQNLQW